MKKLLVSIGFLNLFLFSQAQFENGGTEVDYTMGQVGIGTESPTATLDVIGDIKALHFLDENGRPVEATWNIATNVGIYTDETVTIGQGANSPDLIRDYALNIRMPYSPYSGFGKGLKVENFLDNAIYSSTVIGKALYCKVDNNGFNGNIGYSGYFEGGKFAIKPKGANNDSEFSYGENHAGTIGDQFYLGGNLYIQSEMNNSYDVLTINGGGATAIKATSFQDRGGNYGYSGKFLGGFFYIGRPESTTPDFLVNPDGNISIGTTTNYTDNSETYKLSVNGKIACTALRVKTGWADYVFEDSYNLRSLKELEQYIKENKHLPDVPTAASIEEKGADVGEMQKIMMQKIEELTLYIIQQQKVMDEQQKQIDELKTQIK